MNTDLNSEIQAELHTLGDEEQQRVLEFVRSLKRPMKGTPGNDLAKFAGTIPVDDLRRMAMAIEIGCEQVDLNEW